MLFRYFDGIAIAPTTRHTFHVLAFARAYDDIGVFAGFPVRYWGGPGSASNLAAAYRVTREGDQMRWRGKNPPWGITAHTVLIVVTAVGTTTTRNP